LIRFYHHISWLIFFEVFGFFKFSSSSFHIFDYILYATASLIIIGSPYIFKKIPINSFAVHSGASTWICHEFASSVVPRTREIEVRRKKSRNQSYPFSNIEILSSATASLFFNESFSSFSLRFSSTTFSI